MAARETIQIELLPEEQELLLKYGYPFEPEKRQLSKLIARSRIGRLSISPFYLERLIGDLCHSIKHSSGRLQDQLAELCDRLEYIERTGDGTLDLL